jgi:hypothetical protein
VCGLAAHALAYHSVFPNDRVHGYLRLYVPMVGALTAAAVAMLAALLVACVLGRGFWLRRLMTPSPGRSGTARFASIALPAAAVLVIQETLEHSLETGRLETGHSPASLLALLLAVVSIAALLSVLVRSYAALLQAIQGSAAPPLAWPRWSASWHRSGQLRGRRRSVLAERGGERAPPVPIG